MYGLYISFENMEGSSTCSNTYTQYYISTLKTDVYVKVQFVPHRKLSIRRIHALMLCRKVIGIRCENYKELSNALLRKNVEFLNITACGTYSFFCKGPAADATAVPQPRGLLCNPEMKMIILSLFQVMDHRWN
jgi:hypothetical protein